MWEIVVNLTSMNRTQLISNTKAGPKEVWIRPVSPYFQSPGVTQRFKKITISWNNTTVQDYHFILVRKNDWNALYMKVYRNV